MNTQQNTRKTYPSTRALVADIIDETGKHPLSKPVDYLITLTIIVTTISIILESEDVLKAKFQHYFLLIEYFSLFIFGTEYFLRIWIAPELKRFRLSGARHSANTSRWRYICSPMAIIDLLAILPLLLSMLTVDLRFLRVLRLLRLFKLTRYNSSMAMILSVLKEEKDAILSAFFILFFMLVLASSGIYLLEHDIQPDKFGSIPKAMWWAMVTLTTVGYGDVTPITAGGKLFGGMITLIGIGIVALPAGILASAFSERLHLNRETFEKELKHALEDGKISLDEEAVLKKLQEELNIGAGTAEVLLKREIDRVRKQKFRTFLQRKHKQTDDSENVCPHCGKVILAPSDAALDPEQD